VIKRARDIIRWQRGGGLTIYLNPVLPRPLAVRAGSEIIDNLLSDKGTKYLSDPRLGDIIRELKAHNLLIDNESPPCSVEPSVGTDGEQHDVQIVLGHLSRQGVTPVVRALTNIAAHMTTRKAQIIVGMEPAYEHVLTALEALCAYFHPTGAVMRRKQPVALGARVNPMQLTTDYATLCRRYGLGIEVACSVLELSPPQREVIRALAEAGVIITVRNPLTAANIAALDDIVGRAMDITRLGAVSIPCIRLDDCEDRDAWPALIPEPGMYAEAIGRVYDNQDVPSRSCAQFQEILGRFRGPNLARGCGILRGEIRALDEAGVCYPCAMYRLMVREQGPASSSVGLHSPRNLEVNPTLCKDCESCNMLPICGAVCPAIGQLAPFGHCDEASANAYCRAECAGRKAIIGRVVDELAGLSEEAFTRTLSGRPITRKRVRVGASGELKIGEVVSAIPRNQP
jgi:hypothetical protein